MSNSVIVAMPGHELLTESLAKALGYDLVRLETRRFPDEETYLRYLSPVREKRVVLVASLERPDAKFLPLVFAAAAARDLGALSVGLVAPYLPYMRQDRRFRDGEAVTSTCFARLVSAEFSWLITVDPHLHRYTALSEIYGIPTRVLHAAPLLSDWIRRGVKAPLIVGPDSESEQWVKEVALFADAPYLVLRKVRRGDYEVEISLPDVGRWRGRTPVLIDDIASSARTMIQTQYRLKEVGLGPAICVVVHGIFGGDAYQRLLGAGAAQVVTCNTVPHKSNGIDVGGLLAQGITSFR